MTTRPPAPSRRALLRAMAVLPATALVLGEAPGLLGTALAAAPAAGSATRYTIVPFLNSNDGTVNVYQSDDATDFRLLQSSAYTPPSNRIRDASVFKHTNGYYYVTYTTHTWQDASTTIGFARSSDRVNWTFLYDYTVPISNLSRAWAPEWFVDSDGSVNVIVSCSVTSDEWIFTPYLLKATNSALTAWTSPVALSGIGSNHIDTYIVKVGSTYHAFTKNETAKYIEYGTASSLAAPTRSPGPATGRAGEATARARPSSSSTTAPGGSSSTATATATTTTATATTRSPPGARPRRCPASPVPHATSRSSRRR